MDDRCREFAESRKTGNVCELRTSLSQSVLGFAALNLGRNIGGDAAIAQKAAIRIKNRPAAGLDMGRRAIIAKQFVDKVVKRQMCLVSGDMRAPLLRIFRNVGAKFPSSLADRRSRTDGDW